MDAGEASIHEYVCCFCHLQTDFLKGNLLGSSPRSLLHCACLQYFRVLLVKGWQGLICDISATFPQVLLKNFC